LTALEASPPERSAPDDRRHLYEAVLTTLFAAAGAGAAIVTAVFLLVPNLAPSTSNQATVNNVAVEPRVPLGEYLQDLPVALSLEHNPVVRTQVSTATAKTPDILSRLGTVVDFGYQVVGYRHHQLSVRWTVFDAQSRERLATF